MATPDSRHPAYDLPNKDLRDLCRRFMRGTPNGGFSRAKRADLLTWVIVNGLIERRAARRELGRVTPAAENVTT